MDASTLSSAAYSSPVARATRSIIQLVSPSAHESGAADLSVSWSVISYCDQFSALWAEVDSYQRSYPGSSPRIIIADGLPPVSSQKDVIDAASYLSAYDWLAAWVCSREEQPKYPVLLIDIAGSFAVPAFGKWLWSGVAN